MLKLSKYIYVHILTVLLFIVCAAQGRLFEITAVYTVMLLHECAHLIAAICIGLRVSHITMYPFGVNLKLKNKMICSISDEIILYAAGPFVNAVFALLAIFLYKHFPVYEVRYLYIANIMLFITNLLPAIPLDGGIILKKMLIYRCGTKSAVTVLNIISVMLSAIFVVFGVYVVYYTGFNFSILLMAVLIIGNIFTQKEKYNVDYIRELMFFRDKSKKRVSVKVFEEGITPFEISKSFDFGKYSLVFIINKYGEIKKIFTETEIINNLTEQKQKNN